MLGPPVRLIRHRGFHAISLLGLEDFLEQFFLRHFTHVSLSWSSYLIPFLAVWVLGSEHSHNFPADLCKIFYTSPFCITENTNLLISGFYIEGYMLGRVLLTTHRNSAQDTETSPSNIRNTHNQMKTIKHCAQSLVCFSTMLTAVFALKSSCIEIIQNHPVVHGLSCGSWCTFIFSVLFFPPPPLFWASCLLRKPAYLFLPFSAMKYFWNIFMHILHIPLEASYFIFSVLDNFSVFPVKASRGMDQKTGSLFFGNLEQMAVSWLSTVLYLGRMWLSFITSGKTP